MQKLPLQPTYVVGNIDDKSVVVLFCRKHVISRTYQQSDRTLRKEQAGMRSGNGFVGLYRV
jgi:hypothetical protein